MGRGVVRAVGFPIMPAAPNSGGGPRRASEKWAAGVVPVYTRTMVLTCLAPRRLWDMDVAARRSREAVPMLVRLAPPLPPLASPGACCCHVGNASL